MARSRVFSAHDKKPIVDALRICRDTCTGTMRAMPLSGEAGEAYRATRVFLAALDDYVGVLTGDRTALHLHLTGPPAFSQGTKLPADEEE